MRLERSLKSSARRPLWGGQARVAAVVLEHTDNVRNPLARKAGSTLRPPEVTDSTALSPAGPGSTIPAPARADVAIGAALWRSPSVLPGPRRGLGSARPGRSATLMTPERKAVFRPRCGRAGSVKEWICEARDSHQRWPARNAGCDPRGRPACRAAG